MLATDVERSTAVYLKPLVVFGVLALVLALRIMHWSSALHSPLSYQPGPDEDYYQRFGAAVAGGHGADAPEFTFMDPGYGYLVGAVFKIVGTNIFLVYLLQALLDTSTAFGILLAGRLLGRSREGLIGALLYGLTSTAILFTAALLKETCVACYLIWWVVSALALIRGQRKLAWAAFGVYCGLGIALRSTLLLMACLALLLPVFEPRSPGRAGGLARERLSKSALLVIGMALALLPWSIRNLHAYGGISPLPLNGGIVLHQAYNADNPRSAMWIPEWVNYSHPSEIWRGYAAEAERRTGHALTPPETDHYWRTVALDFIRQHPAVVLADMGRKALAFLAASEIPNNRSPVEERLFSPVLAWLPPPMPWLIAMGLAGMVLLARRDPRWLILTAPVLLAWLTMALFWAEDRFRFHAVPELALLSGVWVGGVAQSLRSRAYVRGLALVALAGSIGAAAAYLATRFPAPPVRWDHIVWGYVKMGKAEDARVLGERIAEQQPDNAPILEALGYVAAAAGQYDRAVTYYERAVALRPRSYLAHQNLAKAYLALGERQKAAAEARVAASLNPSAETEALLHEAEASP
jgi:4-amino-4-deoxy-L-arabinose transferase-like glycosyltransferase